MLVLDFLTSDCVADFLTSFCLCGVLDIQRIFVQVEEMKLKSLRMYDVTLRWKCTLTGRERERVNGWADGGRENKSSKRKVQKCE